MAEFDRVVTDPRLRLADLRSHLAGDDPSQSFLGAFRVATTSGTTGRRSIVAFTNEEAAVWRAASARRMSVSARIHESACGSSRRTEISPRLAKTRPCPEPSPASSAAVTDRASSILRPARSGAVKRRNSAAACAGSAARPDIAAEDARPRAEASTSNWRRRVGEAGQLRGHGVEREGRGEPPSDFVAAHEGDQLGQGKENARQFLKDNPDLGNEIEKKIKEKLGIGPQVDKPADAIPEVPVEFLAALPTRATSLITHD